MSSSDGMTKICETIRRRFHDEFVHFSPHPLAVFQPTAQRDAIDGYANSKPRGLFVSVGTKWIDWCQEEGFFPRRYAFAYIITLGTTNEQKDPLSKILVITSHNLDSFIQEFSVRRKYLNDDVDTDVTEVTKVTSDVKSNENESKEKQNNIIANLDHNDPEDQCENFSTFDWPAIARKYDGIHFTQDVMNLVRGPTSTLKTRLKYLFLCGYDVETLVLWSGQVNITPIHAQSV